MKLSIHHATCYMWPELQMKDLTTFEMKIGKGKSKHFEKIPCQCHFIHEKSYVEA
jgi:hypothetical protein